MPAIRRLEKCSILYKKWNGLEREIVLFGCFKEGTGGVEKVDFYLYSKGFGGSLLKFNFKNTWKFAGKFLEMLRIFVSSEKWDLVDEPNCADENNPIKLKKYLNIR